ncbi:hypothetical protein FQA39_LY17070 [Lamprigera yunnana]|nr:hypothetical protein FQA39_LY17070 [Lamprigera yunnana]
MDDEENSHNENDDPIVKEIPVFVSKRLENQLYLFQFPLRPKFSKSDLNVKRCFVKPQNQAVKLEAQLHTGAANFNVSMAEDIFLRNSITLDKIEYRSSKIVDNTDTYAIGVYNGQEYHLTPLKGLLRLKPYYPHLDQEIKKKNDSKQKSVNIDEPSTSSAKQVTVKFSQGDSDKWKKSRENSYKYILEKQAEEPWIECEWQPEKSELSELEKVKLYAEDTRYCHDSKEMKNEDIMEYLRRLIPEDREQAIILPSLPSNVVSFSSLRKLPLLDQCKLILKDAKIITFQQLMMLLVGCEGLTADGLLKSLPQVATVVRGNWIVKSDILFPNNTFSAISGVPAEFMCRARDYILILFTKNQYVERRKVSSIIKIPSEEIKEIFVGISKLRYNKGWELTLPVDMEFINKYPDVVQRQSSLWKIRELQLSSFFKDNVNKDQKRRKSKSVSEDVKLVNKKEGQTSVRDNCVNSSDTDSGTEKNKGSPVAAKRNKILKNGESGSKEEKL